MWNWVERITDFATRARGTTPGQVGPSFIPRANTTGIRVDPHVALTYSAVFCAIRVVSESIASMPWHVFKHADSQRLRDPLHPVERITNTRANPEMSSQTWIETTLAHAMAWGNAVSEIERDERNVAVAMWPIQPDRINITRDRSGRLVYDISNGTGSNNTVLRPDQVFHLHGLGFDGVQGYSVVHVARNSIGLGMATEQFGASFFGNGTRPGGVLKHPGKLKPEARKNLKESWELAHKGPTKSGSVAILEEGLEWQTMAIPPNDAQFLETRKFQINEVARWFRVPPHKLMNLERATFNTLEQQNLEFVVDGLMPWIRKLELEADYKLFSRRSANNRFTKLSVQSLLRGDVKARGEFYQKMMDRGVFSVNDVLELEDRNPIGKIGDQRFVAKNMIPLDQVGKEPDPVLPPEPPEQPEEDTTDEQGREDQTDEQTQERHKDCQAAASEQAGQIEKAKAATSRVFVDAVQRMMKREANAATRAAKREPNEFASWLGDFFSNQTGGMVEMVGPAFDALVDLVDGDADSAIERLTEYADNHAQQAQEELRCAYESGGEQEVRNLVAQWGTKNKASDLATELTALAVGLTVEKREAA